MSKNENKSKSFVLYCDYCNYKKIVGDLEQSGLFEIKTSNVPGGLPAFDSEKKKFVPKKSLEQPKKFRCPKCGRGIRAKIHATPVSNHSEEIKEFNVKPEEKDFNIGRETGSPGQ
jgi:DNA-directed RNA polymerase subunit RPC12/RpoP